MQKRPRGLQIRIKKCNRGQEVKKTKKQKKNKKMQQRPRGLQIRIKKTKNATEAKRNSRGIHREAGSRKQGISRGISRELVDDPWGRFAGFSWDKEKCKCKCRGKKLHQINFGNSTEFRISNLGLV